MWSSETAVIVLNLLGLLLESGGLLTMARDARAQRRQAEAVAQRHLQLFDHGSIDDRGALMSDHIENTPDARLTNLEQQIRELHERIDTEVARMKALTSRSSSEVHAAFQSDMDKIRDVLQELLAGAYKLRMRGVVLLFGGLLCSVAGNILSVVR